jgi:hypothetical protein
MREREMYEEPKKGGARGRDVMREQASNNNDGDFTILIL